MDTLKTNFDGEKC